MSGYNPISPESYKGSIGERSVMRVLIFTHFIELVKNGAKWYKLEHVTNVEEQMEGKDLCEQWIDAEGVKHTIYHEVKHDVEAANSEKYHGDIPQEAQEQLDVMARDSIAKGFREIAERAVKEDRNPIIKPEEIQKAQIEGTGNLFIETRPGGWYEKYNAKWTGKEDDWRLWYVTEIPPGDKPLPGVMKIDFPGISWIPVQKQYSRGAILFKMGLDTLKHLRAKGEEVRGGTKIPIRSVIPEVTWYRDGTIWVNERTPSEYDKMTDKEKERYNSTTPFEWWKDGREMKIDGRLIQCNTELSIAKTPYGA